MAARDSQAFDCFWRVSYTGREKSSRGRSPGSSASSSATGRGILKNAGIPQSAETAHACNSGAQQGASTREPIIVIPKTIRVDKPNGMSYRRGGGFSAIKQLAVASLGEVHEGIQELISSSGDVRLPRSPRGRSLEGSPPPPAKTESRVLGFDGLTFQRVPSNEWLNQRSDLFEKVPANTMFAKDDRGVNNDIHYLRNEEDRVATARSGASSSRPHSSSQGPRAAPLDKQINNLEKQINYQLPKPLLPEVYQQVWTITGMVRTCQHMRLNCVHTTKLISKRQAHIRVMPYYVTQAPRRPETPRLRIRPPTIPPWNPVGKGVVMKKAQMKKSH